METQKWKKKKERALNEGNLNNLFYACKALAEIYFQEEKYDDALEEYKDMEKASEASGNKMDFARANRMIGEVYSEKGEFSDAIKHQMVHLSISQEMEDSVEEQRALATLGRTYFLQSECFLDDRPEKVEALHMAKTYYMKSLSVCERLSDSDVGHKQRMEMRARLFLNLGLVLESQGRNTDAIDQINKAVMICKKLDLWEDMYRTYSALGSVYQRKGDCSNALATYDLALEVALRLANKNQLMCEILPLKAEVLLELPDFRGSRQVLLRAYKIRSPSAVARLEIERKLRTVAAMCECEEKLTDLLPDEYNKRKKLYEQIADMASELRNFKLALTYYHLMLECVNKSGESGKSLLECYVSLAQTYKDDKNYAKSLEFFKMELILEIDTPSEACKTTLNIAEVLQLMGKTEDMLEAYKEAKCLADQAKEIKLKSLVNRCLKRSLTELNLTDQMDSITWEDLPQLESDSEIESDDEHREFGANICLEDLTDPDDKDDNEEYDKVKVTLRGRTRNKSFLQKRNEKGETPLHVAAIQGNVNLIKKLIDQGHCLDMKDYSGWTPLHEACNHGHLEAVEMLVKEGANVNDRGGPLCDGVTPLLDAACNGCFDIIHFLLDNGASPLMRTNRGETVLDCLSEWRKRYTKDTSSDLEPVNLERYNFLYNKLVRIFEKAGHKVNATVEKSPIESSGKINSVTRSGKLNNSTESSSSIEWSDNRRKIDGNLDESSTLISTQESQRRGNKEGGFSAALEYENAMKALRNRKKPDKVLSLSSVARKGPALLAESENVGDDWLEDDLEEDGGRPKKKRRINSEPQFIGEPLRQTNHHPAPHQHPPSHCHQQSTVVTTNKQRYSFQDSSEDSNDTETILETTFEAVSFGNEDLPSTSGVQSNKLKVMNTVRKKQISLMATGVSREKVKKTEQDSDSSNSIDDIVHSSVLPNVTCAPACLASVKVRIEGKLFLVPIAGNPESFTVGWLAQEAASRYYNIEGIEPELRLETEDGALLADSDPVSLILNSTQLVAVVHSWKQAQLTARYRQLCFSMNAKVDQTLENILEACQATASVSLEDMYLSNEEMQPFFKALSQHRSLQVLSLTGNSLGDQGLKAVEDCILKLPELQVLDLSCTNITADGLSHLAHAVSQNRALQRLHTLKLGYNPLGDCLRELATLLNTIPSLTRLSLPSVGITEQSFRSPPHFSLDCLEYLNVSWNSIGGGGVSDLLGRLNCNCVRALKMAGTSGRVVAEVSMYLDHFRPPALTLIDLSGTQTTNSQVIQLISALEATPSVETVQLETNEDLDQDTVERLVRLALKELRLGGLKVSKELTGLDTELERLSITSCVPQPWGRPAPHALYTTV